MKEWLLGISTRQDVEKKKNVLAIIKLGFRRQGAAAGRRSGPEESLALNVTA